MWQYSEEVVRVARVHNEGTLPCEEVVEQNKRTRGPVCPERLVMERDNPSGVSGSRRSRPVVTETRMSPPVQERVPPPAMDRHYSVGPVAMAEPQPTVMTVSESLKILDEAVCNGHHLVGELSSAVAGILMEEGPSDPEKAPCINGSPMAQAIFSHAWSMQRLNDRVRSVLSRVAL